MEPEGHHGQDPRVPLKLRDSTYGTRTALMSPYTYAGLYSPFYPFGSVSIFSHLCITHKSSSSIFEFSLLS
ncbi:predicted protein [Botrytis cinerea T4]|uniref:Uncharacterized protein n=1 Tax=Botryotinia fuckeliana (strain T4) TaxID=999810 RepID=G2YZG2_BOTF4|nr:predicted protein [Botrytis cinerea T4]